jgi:hypothetical protein
MKWRFVLWMMLATVPAAAQTEEAVRAALYLTGADSPEELDDRLLEELEALQGRPLAINRASHARLLESMLLTPYQVAALEEYRSISGDVLSFPELELVDGFGKEAVDALRPFLSLDSAHLPGEAVLDTVIYRHSAVFRATQKDVGGKYRLSAGRFEGAGAWRGESGTFYALWRTRHGKILAGNYNVRYGQGLAFWSSFQLSGLSTLEAFSKRGNGITPSWSFSDAGTLRGAAWDASFGPVQTALFCAADGSFGAHAGWLGRYGHVGLTATGERLSVEGKYGIHGVDFFGEAAWKYGRAVSGLGGMQFPLGDRFRGAIQVRGIPSAYSGRKNGEYAVAAGLRFRSDDRKRTASLTVDTALLPIPRQDPRRMQVKSVGTVSWTFAEQWLWSPRINLRWRNYEEARTDIRSDLSWTSGPWTVKNRINALVSGGWGWLTYLEGGWKPPGGSLWLRAAAFHTPSWQTRIYCYEHDAPGNFTVPALYGTGFSVSACGGWKKRWKRLNIKLYLRGSYIYEKEKPGQAGLKVQWMVDR